MYDVIFIGGSPGTGKTTTAKLLQEKLKSPRLELSWLRGYHLDKTWSNRTDKEAEMSFENLVFIVKNYIKHGYKNVIVADLAEGNLEQIPQLFKDNQFVIFSLIIKDDEDLKKRVMTESRDSGFRDHDQSIKWNKEIQRRPLLENEQLIDNTSNTPEQTVQLILDYVLSKSD